MTAAADQGVAHHRRSTPLDAAWRETALARQLAALPGGRTVLTCSAPLGTGGLGRHLGEIAAAVERSGEPCERIDGGAREPAPGRARPSGLLARSLLPLSPGVRTRAFMQDFDAYAASRLPAAEALIAFNGQALRQLEAARRRGGCSLGLVSANSHLRQVARRHAEARRRYPLEGSWTRHLVERNLAEYALAERIYVSSRYVRESFLREGFPEERLVDFPLTPDPRYAQALSREPSDRFEVVYVGSLAVHKGVPLLIDAVRRLPYDDLKLVLVGGWGTRGMRRFVQSACAADPRVEVRPGDPLRHLRRASLCVHPAYEDGFAYAPAEALAGGVPLIVSEDTGMKELIDSSESGLVLATGDGQALGEAIAAAYRGEMLTGRGDAGR
ncbi:MAG TPA: glycosyltransferase family 4 protein [Solirubrobacteraceae bacterium]|nr:glycosyltransferase family 4 protein [Solirubrobacteraceae bacterium]